MADANRRKGGYVYILRCADDTLYTGWTNNITGRLKSHNAGQGAKYTRSRLPVELLYLEWYPDRTDARKRECVVKRLTRKQKLVLMGILGARS